MRTGTLIISLLWLGATALGAQPHNSGYLAVGSGGYLHYVDMMGTVKTAQMSGNSGTIYSCVMNVDNETILVYNHSLNSIRKYDPNTLTDTGPFFTDPKFTSTLNVYDLVFDHNGHLFFGSSTAVGMGRGVFEVDRLGKLSTVKAGSTSSSPFYAPQNLSIDIDSAELIVADNVPGDPLYLLERDGSTFTTIASGWNFRYGTFKNMNTGDIFSGTCCDTSTPPQTLNWLPNGSTLVAPFVADSNMRGGYCPKIDRASMAGQRIVSSSWWTSSSPTTGGIWYVDLATKVVTKHSAQITRNTYHVEFVYGRNLQTVATGRGTWDILLDLPNHALDRYAIGFSATGARPGILLADGRRIPLAADPLLFASLSGALGGIVTGQSGTLDVNGEATARLDVSFLPPAVNGIRIWIGAAIFNPSAPLGISVIPDTKVLELEGL